MTQTPYIHLGTWAKTEAIHNTAMVQLNVGSMETEQRQDYDEFGDPVGAPYDVEILVTRDGVDLTGPFTLTKTAGTYDAEGNEITPPVFYPGVFYNMRCYDAVYDWLTKDQVQEDEVDGQKVLRHVLDRVNLLANVTGGNLTAKGVAGNAKFPRRIQVNKNGNPVFAIYSLQDGDVQTPHNVWQ